MQALGLNGNDQQQPQENTTLSQENVGQSSGAGSSASAPAQQQMQQPQASAGARGKVMSKNVAKAKAPTDLNRISSGISSAQKSLQDQANAYVQQADDPYEKTPEQIKGQVSDFASGKSNELADMFRNAPARVEDFKPGDEPKIQDIDLLGTDAGIREMFRRGQDPEGTIGEAALDTALLRRNEGFNQQRDAALNSYKQYLGEKKTTQETARDKAQAARDKAAQQFKTTAEAELRGFGSSLDKQAAEREQAFDAQLAALEEARRANAFSDAQNYLNEMADSGQYDPYMSDALRQGLGEGSLYSENAVDPYQFYTAGRGADTTSANQFYTGDEAQQFERVMGLLGQGGETRAPGALAGATAQDYLGGGLEFRGLLDEVFARSVPKAEGSQLTEQKMAADAKAQKQSQEAYAQKVAAREAEQKRLDAEKAARERELKMIGGQRNRERGSKR